MALGRIGDFLERFAKLAQSSDEAKNTVLQALSNQNIKLTGVQCVSIKGQSVVLKLTAIQKHEVFLKQRKILEELSKNPLTKNITSIH